MKFSGLKVPAAVIAIVSLMAVSLCGLGSEALLAKKVTTHLAAPEMDKKEKRKKQSVTKKDKAGFESVVRNITFMGYDKKTGASKETFFVDNGSDTELKSIVIEISYFNAAKKLIHKREVEINQEFPPRETRKVDINSWDSQKSYHYINSVPSKNGSAPYTVRFKVISFTVD